ncbi:hypothetical protein TNIN_290911 [Trichonephila inaurata madagascariensis]|uniref:Uncharacterized protein n=1 Tax=Trichonephila inaurata madagascariensis TaxID=2747483 RepID=A0A8X6XCC1_9ARAC|nr:hypothetical protein TNIN_290911 [Trichonephila inaurata madagascariensis]
MILRTGFKGKIDIRERNYEEGRRYQFSACALTQLLLRVVSLKRAELDKEINDSERNGRIGIDTQLECGTHFKSFYSAHTLSPYQRAPRLQL